MRTQEDLDRLFTALDTVYFNDELRHRGVRISWKKYRKLKNFFYYGEYYEDTGRITINRVLARPEVPTYVLMQTILHEQLHAILGPDHDGGFAAAEARYVHHAAAAVWESQHFDWLIAQG